MNIGDFVSECVELIGEDSLNLRKEIEEIGKFKINREGVLVYFDVEVFAKSYALGKFYSNTNDALMIGLLTKKRL